MEIQLTTHICAYLDVLGGEKLFSCENLEKAEGIVELIVDLERRLNNMRRDGTPVVRTFTDNVFAAFPLNSTGKYSIEDQVVNFLSEISGQLQQIFLFSDLPVRGGITIGELYIDSKIIIGPAVLQAVHLEKEAKFPRVLIDDNVLELIPNKPGARESFIYQGSDGRNSLSYLRLNSWLLKEHSRFVDDRLIEFRDEAEIKAKYLWLKKYSNDMDELMREFNLI
ncbi:MAG: hypothetical protein HYR92_01290 [Burkholderiales bacterium]|nr:hypothetical protein [Burkholderiales bacterium]